MEYLIGSRNNNRGSLASNLRFFFRHTNQEETQELCGCEVADAPVVVMKFRPMKAGNRLEEKTEMIMEGASITVIQPNAVTRGEGVK